MKKFLIIKSFDQSIWGSCRVISPNLLSSYEKNKENFEIVFFDVEELFEENEKSILALIAKIKIFQPDNLVFVDHLPHPARILQALLEHVSAEELPALIFHVYGDFTYFSKNWSILNDKFIGHKIKFVVASEAQERLLNYFSNDSACTEKFMFPVNEQEYFFSQNEREVLREKMGIKESETIILYSGRISMQKNVDTLIKEFTGIVQKSRFPVHLWIVGGFDDLGATFMGVKNHEGFMFTKIQKIISSLPYETSKTIKFWGLQPKEELRKIKAAADLFVSLSLYHDEDFGMSPAEALASGLPTLLTNWGGYYSFESTKWNCKLVPVTLTPYGHKLQNSKIHEFFKNHTLSYINQNDRQRWSSEFLREYSITAGTVKLKTILEKDFHFFKGFNEKVIQYSELIKAVKVGREISAELNPASDNFYREIYTNYIKQTVEAEETEKHGAQFVQWGYDFVQNAYLNRNKNLSGHDNLYTHYLSPFTLELYGPTNPLLIYGGHEIDELKNKVKWTLRDGVMPLRIFFKEMSPSQTTREILIHKDLWNIVPDNWKNKIKFYSVEGSQIFDKDNLPQKILVAGVVNSMMANPEELDMQLKVLSETLGTSNLKNIEIYTFFPNKMTDFGSSWEEESVIKYSKVIFENLGMNIKFLDFKAIQAETDYSDYLYYEVNNGLFLKDSFLQYIVLSRGGGSLKKPDLAVDPFFRKTSEEKLSFNHRLSVYELDFARAESNLDKYEIDNKTHFVESAVSNSRTKKFHLHWEKWCSAYLLKFQKNSSTVN